MASEDSTSTGGTVDEKMSHIEEKREEMLTELLNQVDEVDRTIESLASMLDVLYVKLTNNAEEIQRNIKHQEDEERRNEDNTILMETAEKMSDLIQSAKDMQNRKVDAMKSLSKLIHFIHADREEICNEKYLDKCKSLTIDKYLSSHEPSGENGDTLVKMLQEQNNRLQLKYKLSREHVQIVTEREKLVSNERKRLSDNLDALRKQSPMESSDSITCEDDHFTSEQSNSKVLQRKKAEGGASIHHDDKFTMNQHPTNPIKRSIDRGIQTENSEEKKHEQLTKLGENWQSIEMVPFNSVYRSVMDRHTTNAIVCSINRGVQTENSKEKSHGKLEKEIEELHSMNENVETKLAEKERLLQSVVSRNVYEVNMIHQTSTKQSRVELELIKKINEGMEQQKCGLNVNRDTFVQRDSKYITIVLCALEPKDRGWESVLKTIEYSCSDLSKIILVVFYEYSEKKKLEESVASMCETLEKFRSVFQLQHSGGVLYRCPTEIRDILQIIIDNGNDRLEVAGCSYCKKR